MPDQEEKNPLEEMPELTVDIHIDIDSLTINDLEFISIMSEGSEKERAAIPGYRVTQFIKRVGGDELGNLPNDQLGPILVEIAKQIGELQNPPGPAGKN